MEHLTTIRDIWQHTLKRRRQAPFVEIWDGSQYLSFTFGQIDNLLKALGAGLLKLGLEQKERIALLGENSPGWMAIYLAIVCGGWTAVPLDKELKGKELSKQIKRVNARHIFVSRNFKDKLKGLKGDYFIHVFDPFLKDNQELSEVLLEDIKWQRQYANMLVNPSDVASIVFTSGTTGAAKAVMLTHYNFVSDIVAACQRIKVKKNDRMMLVLPLHHTFGLTAGLFICAYKGLTLILENSKTRVLKTFQERRPTLFIGVPRIYQVFWSRIENEVKKQNQWSRWQKALSWSQKIKEKTGVNIGKLLFRPIHKQFGGKVRLWISGGAYLPWDLALKFFQIGFPLIQGWGMSETSPIGCLQPYSAFKFYFTRYYERHIGAIGLPLEGVKIELIDVPAKGLYANLGNKEGEMVISGPIVTPGYYEDDKANTASFIYINGERWFRTGDVARKDKEGNLYITGRSKYVIVTSEGKNVHPEEVEEVLNESPLIAESLVLPHKEHHREQVVAIIVPDAEHMRAYLKEKGLDFNWKNIYEVLYWEMKKQLKGIASYKWPVDFAVVDYDEEKGEFVPFEKTTTLKIKRDLYRFSSFVSYHSLKKGGLKKAIFSLKRRELK